MPWWKFYGNFNRVQTRGLQRLTAGLLWHSSVFSFLDSECQQRLTWYRLHMPTVSYSQQELSFLFHFEDCKGTWIRLSIMQLVTEHKSYVGWPLSSTSLISLTCFCYRENKRTSFQDIHKSSKNDTNSGHSAWELKIYVLLPSLCLCAVKEGSDQV